jgi:hypothetical protein
VDVSGLCSDCVADTRDPSMCCASALDIFRAGHCWCAHRCGFRGGLVVVVGGGAFALVALGRSPVGAANSCSWPGPVVANWLPGLEAVVLVV